MHNFVYVMVTTWEDHWDRLQEKWASSTLYPLAHIRDGITEENLAATAKTLFIKRGPDGCFQHSWIGQVSNFRKAKYKGQPAIRFDVSGLRSFPCPDELKGLPNGWYRHQTKPIGSNPPVSRQDSLSPAFFAEIEAGDWEAFEHHCYLLLRLLGIHEIHKIPGNDNRGKADGFFKFESLSVLYDATLYENFQKQKLTQIGNYIGQLKSHKITIGRQSYTIGPDRQVWIMTRNKQGRIISIEDDIYVKEIPYTSLISGYQLRLNGGIRGAAQLLHWLKDLHQ